MSSCMGAWLMAGVILPQELVVCQDSTNLLIPKREKD